MKKLFISAMICLFAVSCSNEGEGSIKSIEGNEVQYAQVSVNVSGFSASVDEFPGTRTLTRTAVGDYADVKAIDLAFYSANGTEVYKHTQWREDATTYTTFGSFSCNLPLGSYTLVVIARGGKSTDVLTLTSPTAASYTSDYARETFAATQAVTVSNTSPLNLSPELSRIMAKLNIVSTDAKPVQDNRFWEFAGYYFWYLTEKYYDSFFGPSFSLLHDEALFHACRSPELQYMLLMFAMERIKNTLS